MLYMDYSLAAQTAFAGLDGAAQHADLNRSVADVPGGFAKKTVAGRVYWYFQMKTAQGALQQSYVGPDDEKTRELIAAHSNPQKKNARLYFDQLAKSAIALGCAEIPTKHARVIGRLADNGFFSAGGILVGTHAFLAYQNIFGVRWNNGANTLDLDFAHAGRNVSLALPENITIDTHSAIESLQMGFVPNNSRTSFKKVDEPDFDLDFLTSRGRTGDLPVEVPRLGLTLQPLKFMELSLEDPMRCTLIAKSGPIVVNIPRPERYVLHKLIVAGERPLGNKTKANKDIIQAAALMDYLLDNSKLELGRMWLDVVGRGPGWERRLKQGFSSMSKLDCKIDFEGRLQAAIELAIVEKEDDLLDNVNDPFESENPAAGIKSSEPKGESICPGPIVREGSCSGAVVSSENGIVAQRVNRNGDCVYHLATALSRPVVIGEVVDIAYDSNGQGVIMEKGKSGIGE